MFVCALVGGAFYYFLAYFWAYFPDINPIFRGLISCCSATSWFRPTLLAHDIFINILLSIPLALFIVKLKPKNVWMYVLSAVLTIFVAGHHHLLFSADVNWQISDISLGWGMELYSLPIAILLITFLGKSETT